MVHVTIPDASALEVESQMNGSTRRHNPRRSATAKLAAFMAALMASFVLVPASSAQTAPEPPRTEDDLRELQAAVARAAVPGEPASGEILQPEESVDPTSPAELLRSALDRFNDLAPGRGRESFPPSSRDLLASAREDTADAMRNFAGGEPDLETSIEAIVSSLAEIERVGRPRGRPFARNLFELAQILTSAGREMASGVLEVAVDAGADRTVLADASAALSRGDQQARAGDFDGAAASYATSLKSSSGGIVFDIDLFEQNVREAMAGKTVGYTYAIARNGTLYSSDGEGLARRSVDPPETPQSPTKEMYTASMSKTISAAALLRALHEAGISVDEPIIGFLPPEWDPGPNIEDVTFRKLLTHTSKLKETGGTKGGQVLSSLQDVIEEGIPSELPGGGLGGLGGDEGEGGAQSLAGDPDSDYNNANFSLMRVLIPRIAYGQEGISYFQLLGAELDVIYAGLYEVYVKLHVMEPAEIAADACEPDESIGSRTLYYPFPPGTVNGSNHGDWSLSCGATGWYLSSHELGSFLAHLRFTSEIIQPETRKLMDDHYLGWLNPGAFGGWLTGKFGIYRGHGGDYSNVHGCMMNFPSASNPDFPGMKVQAAVQTNSDGIGGAPMCGLLRDAFDNAWVPS